MSQEGVKFTNDLLVKKNYKEQGMSGVGKKSRYQKLLQTHTKKGYSHTSVEDITNEMGIAKGSFYTYFKSKNLLLKTIAEKKIDEMIEKQDNILKNALSFEETLKEYYSGKT